MKPFALIFFLFFFTSCGPEASRFFKMNAVKFKKSHPHKVFFVTWNSEYSPGSEETLSIIKNRVLRFHKNPEVFAVCTQEATDKKGEGTLGKRLAGKMEGYELLEENRIVGMTKLSKGNNFTGLSLLAEKSFLEKIKKGTVKKGQRRPDILRGTKGAVWVSFEYEGAKTPLVVACAHLDALSKDRRRANIQAVSKGLEKIETDKVILAGDLNYKSDLKLLGLDPKNKKAITVKDFIEAYLVRGEEAYLNLYHGSELKKDLDAVGFDCSGYEKPFVLRSYYPPTYKQSYKSEENRAACARYKKNALKRRVSKEIRYEEAKACFFPDKEETDFVSLKAGELSFGYLDRVCVKKEGGVSKLFQGSLPVFESDHAPVWSLLSF